MARQNGYWVGDQFVETNAPIKTGREILVEAGRDPMRTVVAVNTRGERTIIDKSEHVQVGQYERFEDLPSFIYG